MKIDVLTKKNLEHLEEMIRVLSNNLHEDIKRLRLHCDQLQDRIKILESNSKGVEYEKIL